MIQMLVFHPNTCMLCLCVCVVRESLSGHGEFSRIGWKMKLMMCMSLLKCLGCVFVFNFRLDEIWVGFLHFQMKAAAANPGARPCVRRRTPVCLWFCERTPVCMLRHTTRNAGHTPVCPEGHGRVSFFCLFWPSDSREQHGQAHDRRTVPCVWAHARVPVPSTAVCVSCTPVRLLCTPVLQYYFPERGRNDLLRFGNPSKGF